MFHPSLLTRAVIFYGCRFPNHPRKWWLHDRIRRCLGIKIDQEVSVERGGLRWSLNPADYSHSDLFWLGRKHVWEIHHLRRLLRPGCVIMDVGANFGYWGATLAMALKRRCRVLALEPHPANFARLVRHVEWNRLEEVIECCQVGVSDAAGSKSMVMPEGNSGHARIVSDRHDGEVALMTLDAFSESRGLERLDALLLDVEGYEDRALRGATKMLDRLRPLVVVELWPPVMEQQGTSVEAVARLLDAHGYELFFPHRRHLVPLLKLPAGDRGIYVFCLHRERGLTGLA